jgi:hypothetical protein
MQQMYERVTGALGGGKDALTKQADFLEKAQRIVPDYKKGSLEMPLDQIPLIPEIDIPVPDKDIIGSGRWESPHNIMGRAFGRGKSAADALLADPAIDAMESHMTYATNLKNYTRWAKDVLKGVPSAKDKVVKALRPLFKEYEPLMKEYARLMDRARILQNRLNKIPAGDEKLETQIAEVLAQAEDQSKVLAPMIARYDMIVEGLAKAHPDVRIALHAGDELPAGIKLSKEETAVSDALRGYMEATRDRLKELGIPVIESKNYMTHLWRELLNDKNIPDKLKFRRIPTLLRFMSRLPESRMWIPSANEIMAAYIPNAEYKVAFQPFLSKWTPFIEELQHGNLKRFMQEWVDENLNRRYETIAERGLNAIVTLEYVRLIGLSVSVGFKHIMKLANTWSRYGVSVNIPATMKAAKIPVQAAAKRLGYKGKTGELKLFRAFVNSRAMVRALDEIPALKSLGMNFRMIMSQPVVAVEAMDNAVSVLAGVFAGGKNNVPPEVIHRAIWKTILDANFRAGWDQPLWQKRATGRAVGMFQMTPWKLAEMKIQLVERAFKGQRDAFGTHYGTMLLRYLIIMGMAEGTARQYDTSVLNLFLHLPMFSHTLKPIKKPPYFEFQLKPSHSPVMAWWAQMAKNGVLEGSARHFGYLGQFTKVMKILNDNYPEDYYATPEAYLLGLEKVHKGGKKSRRRSRSRRKSTKRSWFDRIMGKKSGRRGRRR